MLTQCTTTPIFRNLANGEFYCKGLYMLKSGHKTFKRNAKFIRRSTVPDESQEANPLEGRRHSGGRKQPPFEAKIDHTTSVIGPVTRSRART